MDIVNQNKNRKQRRTSSVDLSTMVYGKIPPQARELEEAVLGAILIVSGAFDTAIELSLTEEAFYVDAHQKIFAACKDLRLASQPIDMLTLTQQLKKNETLDEIGGAYYVTKLTNGVVSSANIEAHIRIIQQKFILREIIRACGEAIGDAYEDSTDTFDLLDKLQQTVFAIGSNILSSHIYTMVENMVSFYTMFDAKMQRTEAINGAPSGFHEIDECTNGWQASDLIVLAARPSVGKTALALNFAINAASNLVKPTPTAFFSLEMSRSQLTERIISAETGIPLARVRRGRVDEAEYKRIQEVTIKLEKLPLYIDDTAALTWMDLRVKVRKMIKKFGVRLVFVDYLQLMNDVRDGSFKNKEQQTSNISRQIKLMAKEFGIPIVALSQLSRDVEKRGGKEKVPVLSDLRDSGAIEQDADLVAFIYRPEIIEANHIAGETYVRIAKHRNGALETIKLISKLHIQKFYSKDDSSVANDKTFISDGVKSAYQQAVDEDPNWKF